MTKTMRLRLVMWHVRPPLVWSVAMALLAAFFAHVGTRPSRPLPEPRAVSSLLK